MDAYFINGVESDQAFYQMGVVTVEYGSFQVRLQVWTHMLSCINLGHRLTEVCLLTHPIHVDYQVHLKGPTLKEPAISRTVPVILLNGAEWATTLLNFKGFLYQMEVLKKHVVGAIMLVHLHLAVWIKFTPCWNLCFGC